jgi:hypothetical protein
MPMNMISKNDLTRSNSNNTTCEQDELFALLDNCIDVKLKEEEEFFSLKDIIQGHPNKKHKTTDLKPVVFLRFNSRHSGKPTKVVTLKALLDSGESSGIIAKEHTKKLKTKKREDIIYSCYLYSFAIQTPI